MISTPSAIRRQWGELYMLWGIPEDMQVPEPNFNQAFVEEMAALEVPRVPIYVHAGLTFMQFGQLFPTLLDHCLQERGPLGVESYDQAGWLFVEETPEAAHLGTNQAELQKTFETQGARGATETVFLIYGRYYRETHAGQPPYLKTWARLLGSFCAGQMVYGSFYADGSPHMNSKSYQRPEDAFPHLGGLSAVVPS